MFMSMKVIEINVILNTTSSRFISVCSSLNENEELNFIEIKLINEIEKNGKYYNVEYLKFVVVFLMTKNRERKLLFCVLKNLDWQRFS